MAMLEVVPPFGLSMMMEVAVLVGCADSTLRTSGWVTKSVRLKIAVFSIVYFWRYGSAEVEVGVQTQNITHNTHVLLLLPLFSLHLAPKLRKGELYH